MVFSFETEKIKQKKARLSQGENHTFVLNAIIESCAKNVKPTPNAKAATCQRPQSKQAHQRLPVCSAHPAFAGRQCEDGDDQRGQPSHWLVRADGAGDLFPEIVYAALFGGPLWDKEQLPNYHEDGLVSDG